MSKLLPLCLLSLVLLSGCSYKEIHRHLVCSPDDSTVSYQACIRHGEHVEKAHREAKKPPEPIIKD